MILRRTPRATPSSYSDAVRDRSAKAPPAVTPTRSQESIDGVGVHHIERVFSLLRDKLPKVLAANRYFEEQTGIHNEAGTNNIVDAFSHLATLVEHAEELDDERQSEQVAHLEDHLRRSMMEAFEQVLKYRLGEIAELWDENLKTALPLRAQRRLTGAPTIAELEKLRRLIKELLDRGRETKRDITWEAWEEGTDFLVQACAASDQLMAALEESIAIAKAARVRRRYVAGAVLLAALTFVIGLGLGSWLL